MTVRTDEASGRRTRAAPMSPEQRRDAIIAATVPLVREHGFDVSTRQIADAAGIAEGTIFRVFDDKKALLHHVVEAAMHPGATEEQLDAVDPALPLEQRMLMIADIMNERLTSVFQLMAAIGFARPPGDDGSRRHRPPQHDGVMKRVEALLEPDRDRLRAAPAVVAEQLRVLCFAGFHPLITDHHPLTPAEVVDLLLHGVMRDTANDPSP